MIISTTYCLKFKDGNEDDDYKVFLNQFNVDELHKLCSEAIELFGLQSKSYYTEECKKLKKLNNKDQIIKLLIEINNHFITEDN